MNASCFCRRNWPINSSSAVVVGNGRPLWRAGNTSTVMALLKVCARYRTYPLPRVRPFSQGQPWCNHKNQRSLRHLTGGWGSMVRLLVKLWIVLTWTCTPGLTITLPVTMQGGSHPADFLTVEGKDPQVSEGGSSARSHTPMDIDKVREEEVLYHLYKNGPLGASYPQRRASTVFLVELFNDLVQGVPPGPPGRKRLRQKQIREGEGKKFPLTDTIRSFSATGVTRKSPSQKTVVHFTTPYLPPNERLGTAELRFLHQRQTTRARTRSRYKLSLVVSRGGRVVQRVVLKERGLLQREYVVFDVSRVLERWINAFHGNFSLQIRLPRRLESFLQLKNASLVSTSLIALYLQDRDFLRNMYESYTTDDSHVQSNSIPHTTRDHADVSGKASHQSLPSRKKRGSSSTAGDKRGVNRRKSKNRKNTRWYRAPKNSKCRMYDFKVDFHFIGWGQWIIHPKDFNAKFCYGSCPSPVESKYQPTNHAMLQTLMRQKKRRLAPPTCCVPTRLKPLSMLYFEYGEIVVRHHEDMIADECGCR